MDQAGNQPVPLLGAVSSPNPVAGLAASMVGGQLPSWNLVREQTGIGGPMNFLEKIVDNSMKGVNYSPQTQNLITQAAGASPPPHPLTSLVQNQVHNTGNPILDQSLALQAMGAVPLAYTAYPLNFDQYQQQAPRYNAPAAAAQSFTSGQGTTTAQQVAAPQSSIPTNLGSLNSSFSQLSNSPLGNNFLSGLFNQNTNVWRR